MPGKGTHPPPWSQGSGSGSGATSPTLGAELPHLGESRPCSTPGWGHSAQPVPTPSPWGRGARVPGLSLPTKATGLPAGRARGEPGSLCSGTSGEGWVLTRCRLYSQQINNFLSWQQRWPVRVHAGGSRCPPSRLSPLPEGPPSILVLSWAPSSCAELSDPAQLCRPRPREHPGGSGARL